MATIVRANWRTWKACASVLPWPRRPPAPRTSAPRFGGVRLKWERHGEFSGYLLIAIRRCGAALCRAGGDRCCRPNGWPPCPGRTIAATHVDIVPASGMASDAAALAQHFGGHGVAGAEHRRGCRCGVHRFSHPRRRLLALPGARPRPHAGQAGRTLQRLVEIEAYRMLALLALADRTAADAAHAGRSSASWPRSPTVWHKGRATTRPCCTS